MGTSKGDVCLERLVATKNPNVPHANEVIEDDFDLFNLILSNNISENNEYT